MDVLRAIGIVRMRDVILIPLGFWVILLILKFTGVISPHTTALGTAALLALILAVKLLPSRAMRVIAGLLIFATIASVAVPWILSFYFPYTKQGLEERRELTDLWTEEQTGGEVKSLIAIRRHCREIEDITLKHNLHLFKENLETLRKNESFDPKKLEGDFKKFEEIQKVRQICSRYLQSKAKIQMPEGGMQENDSPWSVQRWFLFSAIVLIAAWFIGMFYAIRPLHKTAVILLLVLLISWLVMGNGVTTIGKLFDDSGVVQQSATTEPTIAPPAVPATPVAVSITTAAKQPIKSVQKAAKRVSFDLWMFIGSVIFLISMYILKAFSWHPRRMRIIAWSTVFIAYALRVLLWMATQGNWENIFNAFSS